MAPDSDIQRYGEALAHITQIDQDLAADIAVKTGGRMKLVGDELSLSGAGYSRTGTKEQHIAVRALLLCLITYFRTPHHNIGRADAAVLTATKAAMKSKSILEINAEILQYTRLNAKSHAGLVAAADLVDHLGGVVDPLTRIRGNTSLSNAPVCYHGVAAWLFEAGYVSKRWYAKEGSQLTGQTARNYLGTGKVKTRDEWHTIPQGHLFYIHKAGDFTTCHWGLSLGGGRAVGCNNTDGSPGQADLFYDGGGVNYYGKFQFRALCDILNSNNKYKLSRNDGDQIEPKIVMYDNPAGDNIVVRDIDPITEVAYY